MWKTGPQPSFHHFKHWSLIKYLKSLCLSCLYCFSCPLVSHGSHGSHVSRRPARDADPQIGQTKSYGYIKLYIWIKITLRCVDSSEIGCILSQWNQTFAIYMTKIQKWKQERCVAIRFFLSNLRILTPSLVSVLVLGFYVESNLI